MCAYRSRRFAISPRRRRRQIDAAPDISHRKGAAAEFPDRRSRMVCRAPSQPSAHCDRQWNGICNTGSGKKKETKRRRRRRSKWKRGKGAALAKRRRRSQKGRTEAAAAAAAAGRQSMAVSEVAGRTSSSTSSPWPARLRRRCRRCRRRRRRHHHHHQGRRLRGKRPSRRSSSQLNAPADTLLVGRGGGGRGGNVPTAAAALSTRRNGVPLDFTRPRRVLPLSLTGFVQHKNGPFPGFYPVLTKTKIIRDRASACPRNETRFAMLFEKVSSELAERKFVLLGCEAIKGRPLPTRHRPRIGNENCQPRWVFLDSHRVSSEERRVEPPRSLNRVGFGLASVPTPSAVQKEDAVDVVGPVLENENELFCSDRCGCTKPQRRRRQFRDRI